MKLKIIPATFHRTIKSNKNRDTLQMQGIYLLNGYRTIVPINISTDYMCDHEYILKEEKKPYLCTSTGKRFDSDVIDEDRKMMH